MIELLMPLGLLGLLGIAVLIIIYILKPNYQQKVVSSTHVWKLSLRYRRKQIPINRLLSLLILLCQILIVTACALILAQPFIPSERIHHDNERIVVIDASADMLAAHDGETRFERAVEDVYELTEDTLRLADGRITLILANNSPEVVIRRADASTREQTLKAVDALLGTDEKGIQCSYGQADVEAAFSLVQEILSVNPEAQVFYYTATEYADPGEVTVVDVSVEGEWNAGICDASVELDENYYSVTTQIGAYGRSAAVTVSCEFYGVNAENTNFTLHSPSIMCVDGMPQTVIFRTRPMGGSESAVDGVTQTEEGIVVWSDANVYAYDRIRVYVSTDMADDFSYDDSIELYGGRSEPIKILYSSSSSTFNIFLSNALMSLRDSDALGASWDIEIDQSQAGSSSVITGYDFYVYEGKMPEAIPTDGVVLLINPGTVPVGAGFEIDTTVGTQETGAGVVVAPSGEPFTMTATQPHAITDEMTPESVPVSKYTRIMPTDEYEVLLTVNSDPALLIKDTQDIKVAILSFSLNDSLFAIMPDFGVMIFNLYKYFIPYPVSDGDGQASSLFEVGEEVTINARGEVLSLTMPLSNEQVEHTELPESLVLNIPGTYNYSQTLMTGVESTGSFYVKVAASESDLTASEEGLPELSTASMYEDNSIDLLLFFALALFALLFIEWLLQVKENY